MHGDLVPMTVALRLCNLRAGQLLISVLQQSRDEMWEVFSQNALADANGTDLEDARRPHEKSFGSTQKCDNAASNRDNIADECPICLEPLLEIKDDDQKGLGSLNSSTGKKQTNSNGRRGSVVMKLPCKHIFHLACVQKLRSWGAKECPTCRAPLPPAVEVPSLLPSPAEKKKLAAAANDFDFDVFGDEDEDEEAKIVSTMS